MNLPSVQTIAERLTKGNKAKARAVRALLEDTSLNIPDTMDLVSDVIGGCGEEYIPGGRNDKSPAIRYVNMGDPYINTLLYVNGSFRVGCWGDIVERGDYE